jgi:hypothetical protein
MLTRRCAAYVFLPLTSSMILALNASSSRGLQDVTTPWSTTTSEPCYFGAGTATSVLIDLYEVVLRPWRCRSRSGATARGVPRRDDLLGIENVLDEFERLRLDPQQMGLICPPGSTMASKFETNTSSSDLSTFTGLPQSFLSQPFISPPCNETTWTVAPAAFSRSRGTSSSAYSNPFVAKIAIVLPFKSMERSCPLALSVNRRGRSYGSVLSERFATRPPA